MRRLTVAQVHAQKVSELGLDAGALDLTSIEAIAGALRRVACFLCPCSAATLVRGVIHPLRGLVDDTDAMKTFVEQTLDAMIAHGDLFEQPQVQEDGFGAVVLVYAAPPSFVLRQSGSAILLGIASDHLSALPDDLQARIEYVNHVRRVAPIAHENLRDELLQVGLIEVSDDVWLSSPPAGSAADHLLRLDRLLDAAGTSRTIPGLLLLDPERPVQYYRGRWVEPRSQTGRFVARRSQAYGADLWCYVELHEGQSERLLDLPLPGSRWRGCDEAWQLQLAIDATRGHSQRFRLRPLPNGAAVLELFSPLPMWARRRWDAIGEPVPTSGCLFGYRLRREEIPEEALYARAALWLGEVSPSIDGDPKGQLR